ncbi:NAD-dependent epimerase/dehydratase family protein [Hugenholtzia roseola]|uniref:NAD-dependent epimerase/dehydratase family protein n=1 Tax=Hugenholtzia roseola TaxID=1002 RepID=UPI000402BAC8|nr:NAD-dependent epimerase/dehydratase family protein [Hugenholtzia roseola]
MPSKNIELSPKSATILGAGWLGFPLALYLAQEHHFEINATTTTVEKIASFEAEGIKPYLLELPLSTRKEVALDAASQDSSTLDSLFETAFICFAFPPKSRNQKEADTYSEKVQSVIDFLSEKYKNLDNKEQKPKLIFLSSTSVYPDCNQEVEESYPITAQNSPSPHILAAENILKTQTIFDYCILRLAGLMGYDRCAGKYFAGQQNLTFGNQPVNHVHRADVVRIIYEIMREENPLFQQQIWNQVFNVVAPIHPLRKRLYLSNAFKYKFEPPIFVESPAPPHKVVRGEKLEKALDYDYLFPNPLEFL